MLLPRCLVSFLVLAVVFAVACGTNVESLDKEFDEVNDLISLLEVSLRNDEVSEMINPSLAAILKYLQSLIKVASMNCIKKIIVNCIVKPSAFINCAKEFLNENKMTCGSPIVHLKR
ncbi:uncharacterized protein LOC106640917 [Copidosoma floridanum]|uniref:uncharacterized protein LOC106640917 n=1 Tax=Copidosoma floridanum TaxID=29053 RepID=UPI0006C9C79B|nr:uncharacterized protein LOC106640917 [Copidosoma floridanum]